MIKKLLYFLTVFSFFSCGLNQTNESSVWVYIEMKDLDNSKSVEDFFFGEIKGSVVEEMRSNTKAKGIFFVDNIRYINEDDLLQVYEDSSNTGISAYRLENIKTMDILKDDPVLTFKENELHKSSKEVRAEKQSKINPEN